MYFIILLILRFHSFFSFSLFSFYKTNSNFFSPLLSSFSSVTLKHTHIDKPTERYSTIVNLTHQRIQINASGLWINGLVLMICWLVAEISVCGSTEMDWWIDGGGQRLWVDEKWIDGLVLVEEIGACLVWESEFERLMR